MRRITKEWLLRQPVRMTFDPAPFPGLPTKVFYGTRYFTYMGEPSGRAYRRFIKEVNSGYRYIAIEYDRKGPIQIANPRMWPQPVNLLLKKFYQPATSVYNTPGDFAQGAWSVRRIGGHRCYIKISREQRLSAITIAERKAWLVENGVTIHERARRDKATF